MPALTWTTFLLWLGCAAVAGVLLWHLFGLLVVPSLPARLRNPFGSLMLQLGLWANDGSVLVERLDGSTEIVPFDRDADHESIVFHLDGERREVDDPTNAMSSLARRRFGIVVEGVGSVLRPAFGAVAEDEQRKVADGGHVQVVEDSDSGEMVFAHNPYTRLDDSERVVDMRSIMGVLSQVADTDLAKRVQTRTEAAQSGYGGMSDIKLLLVAGISMAAGIGLTWLMLSSGGGGGGPSVPVGMLRLAAGVP
jgi:hypothetical protein